MSNKTNGEYDRLLIGLLIYFIIAVLFRHVIL